MVDRTHMLNLPQNVNAWDARIQLQKGGFNVLAEYAEKTQDPSFTNGYIYRKGNVAMSFCFIFTAWNERSVTSKTF